MNSLTLSKWVQDNTQGQIFEFSKLGHSNLGTGFPLLQGSKPFFGCIKSNIRLFNVVQKDFESILQASHHTVVCTGFYANLLGLFQVLGANKFCL